MTAREVLAGIKAEHSGHVKCVDCGKCRVHPHEDDWCDECRYMSCERGIDCIDDHAPATVARLTAALEAVLSLAEDDIVGWSYIEAIENALSP